MKPMTPLLEVIALSHHFGGLEAIGDFSLTVQAGELVGLIGPNGAGKTTIFNLITGVFRIEAGRIRFQGQDISAWAPPASPRPAFPGPSRTSAFSRG
jgi:branched-chain amino acid transport system ATP-binding protein